MIFNASNIEVVESINNWEEAIRKASENLIKNKYIEERYVEAMISSVKKLGFYIVLADLIAMPHARPENGVLKTGVSFLKLNNAVKFGENDVKFIFVLAAINSDSHIDTIKELMKIFQNENKMKKLENVKTKEEILAII
ncbi:PTS sugar transporter subunit IIA [Caviibacter abscessus]|uniref:PTS sugar transporter subunit IIA n=1 Tax=Caviibacter abscessus TaxID=1766719 RepID=UPI000829BD5F|nr:PTS sugar transporter subunit IIA [Caviibacter abscessus]